MNYQPIFFVWKKLAPLVQVLAYIGLFILSQQLVAAFKLPLPANLIGLLILLLLIACRAVPVHWVKAGSQLLLADMLLFFVPSVVAVINYQQLLITEGYRIYLVIFLSTLCVLGFTAYVVDKVYRYELMRIRARRARS